MRRTLQNKRAASFKTDGVGLHPVARMSFSRCYYDLSPVFGTICFAVGAALLFMVSLGSWRVRSWPRFNVRPRLRLELFLSKERGYTYFSADAALLVGFAFFLCVLFAGLAYLQFAPRHDAGPEKM